jgi:O-antigen ligase
MLFGVVFLGLTCFAGKIFVNGGFSPLRFCLWLALMIYTLMVIVFTQSRTAMVSLIPALLVGAVYLFVAVKLPQGQKPKLAAGLTSVLLLALVVGYQTGLFNLVTDSFERESVVVSKLMDRDLSNIPKTSWGLRVHFLIEGAKGVMERPWTGWGYRAGKIILDQEGLLKGDNVAFSQVHNTYFEATLRYGFGAVIIILLLFGWGLRGLWLARKAQLMEADMFGFLAVALVFFIVTNLFDGMMFQTEGVLLFNMLMGVATSFIFLNKRNQQRAEVDSHDYTT